MRRKAKRVIWLYMAGGPSHLETFDYKPQLAEMHGQPMPESFTKGQPIAQLQGPEAHAASRRSIRSASSASRGRRSPRSSRTSARSPTTSASSARCKTEAINHDPAHTFMNTGTTISGRPAMGSWLTYGLGSEATTCPASSC